MVSGQISADLVEWLAADQKVRTLLKRIMFRTGLEPGCPEIFHFGHSPNIVMLLAGFLV